MAATTSVSSAAASPDAQAAGGEASGIRHIGFAVALLAIGAAEALAIALLVSGSRSVWVEFVAVHLVALGALCLLFALAFRAGRDATMPLLGLIGGAGMGPVGILGAGILGLTVSLRQQPSRLILEWYERIALSTAVDAETRLCDDVGVGRTLDLGAIEPEAFPTIMESGPLVARQTVLGLIARQFHPSYLETLTIALKSPAPSIRVQAAAVATDIGPELRRQFQQRMAAVDASGRDPISALDLLGQLGAFIDCGLLDAGERQRAIDLAAHLGDRILEWIAERPLRLPYATDPVRALELEVPLEQLLLSRGRFAEFRAHRSARRIQARHPTARMRRLGRPRQLPEMTA